MSEQPDFTPDELAAMSKDAQRNIELAADLARDFLDKLTETLHAENKASGPDVLATACVVCSDVIAECAAVLHSAGIVDINQSLALLVGRLKRKLAESLDTTDQLIVADKLPPSRN